MKVTVYSAIKHETTSRVLPEVFSVVDTNPRAIAIAMRVYLANARQDTAKTKTRSEVTMTGKKVYKQKGTGGARHGSKRAPIFVGGGVTFGPHGNKNSALSLPRRQRARSLAQAFSLKSTQVSLMVDLDLAKGKTAIFAKAFDRIDHKANSMIMVIAPSERALARGMRNLSAVSVCYADQVNSYDVIRADQVVMSEEAVTILTSRLTVKKNDKKSETVVVAPEAVEPLEPELVETVEKPVVTKSVAKTVVKKPAVKKPVIKKPTVKKPAATTKTKTVKTKKTA